MGADKGSMRSFDALHENEPEIRAAKVPPTVKAARRGQARMLKSLQNSPGAITLASGCFAQAEFADEILRSPWRDAESVRDHGRGGDGTGHHIIDECGQF